MVPFATESTTARATAAWAGPNIWTACLAPLIVTLLKRTVSGLQGRFGATTARSVVNPSLLLARAFTNAAPAGPDFEPIIRSMWATSLPSPTSDSPRKKSAAMSLNSCTENVRLSGIRPSLYEQRHAQEPWKSTSRSRSGASPKRGFASPRQHLIARPPGGRGPCWPRLEWPHEQRQDEAEGEEAGQHL